MRQRPFPFVQQEPGGRSRKPYPFPDRPIPLGSVPFNPSPPFALVEALWPSRSRQQEKKRRAAVGLAWDESAVSVRSAKWLADPLCRHGPVEYDPRARYDLGQVVEVPGIGSQDRRANVLRLQQDKRVVEETALVALVLRCVGQSGQQSCKDERVVLRPARRELHR